MYRIVLFSFSSAGAASRKASNITDHPFTCLLCSLYSVSSSPSSRTAHKVPFTFLFPHFHSSSFQLVWRVVVAVSPMIRLQLIERRGKLTADPNLERAIKRMKLGDYFLLTVLGINLDVENFKDILLKFTNCHDDGVHHNDPSYCPYSNLDEVDGKEIGEAHV